MNYSFFPKLELSLIKNIENGLFQENLTLTNYNTLKSTFLLCNMKFKSSLKDDLNTLLHNIISNKMT